MKKIIVKYLTDKITKKELEKLTIWLKDPENQNVFKKYIENDYKLNLLLNKVDSETQYQNIKHSISKKDASIKQLPKFWFKYAAVVVLLLGVTFFYKHILTPKEETLILKDDPITLKLHDGSIKTLDTKTSKQLFDANGKVTIAKEKNKISYSSKNEESVLIYNTLEIPYGKNFELTLSDGTNVFLNSGTTIKYPTKFIKGKNRQIYLTGEAYFDVAHDKDHPFIVNAQGLNVQVLGTKFNIAAYANDVETNVVLVEGKVSLYDEKDKEKTQSITILPNTKGIFNKTLRTLQTQKVNPELYTAWVKKELVFRNTSFDDILKKIERHYNVTVVNQNKALNSEVFNARFKKQPIDSVLSYLSDSYNIKYTIKKGKLIIK